MSEIVNTATIKVVADASGVQEGLAKVEQSAVKTGRTLDTLGGKPGLRPLGDGAGESAVKVDRATKSMADAIQRATAAMDSGAKGSASYYAALANSRGLNVAALAPYLAQLDAVTKKTAMAAEAQRQLEAGNRLLDGLRSQAEGIGKTASQLAALRAEQLGVADAARPLIEQLQAAEEAAGGAEESVSGFASAVAAIGLGGGIATVAQLSDEYGKFVSQLELATTGQTEFTNAQNAVRRIATAAQSELSATGSLYANITKGTRELGLAQTEVANITETISLALKVSGASGAEASSAILQLSQAFASGVLRGDEFNSVNEAAPRLMQALADGIGVPTGALRKMAEEGELTTAVLAQALPRALETLRGEAQSVETIGGAVTVLKNNVLELVGATAQSNGVVSVLSGGVKLLADNLVLAGGAMATVAAVKLGTALAASAKEAYASAAANSARLASNVTAARADVTATAAASALANARVAELRASVLAAEGAAALAITTNGLIPAQARAAAASAAHTTALTRQAAAIGAAATASRLAAGALTILGGPVGAVITLLGLGATAWAMWGDSANKAEQDAAGSVKASTEEVLENLDIQIERLRERNRLASIGFKPAEVDSPAGERLGEVVAQIDRAGRGTGEYANLSLEARTEILKVLGKQYGELTGKIAEFNRESAIDTGNKNAKSASEWMQKYATGTEKMNAELAKAKKELGDAFTPELEARIRKQFAERNSSLNKEKSAYESLLEVANERAAATAREAASMAPLSEAQKLQARVEGEILSGKLKMNPAQKALLEGRIAEIAATEEVIASQKRAAQGAADWLKIEKEWQDTAARKIEDATKEAEKNEELARTFGLTKSAIEALELARLEEQLSQRSSLGLTLDEITNLEKLIDAKKRNAAAVSSIESQEANKKAVEKASQDLDRFLDPTRAQTFGEALKGAFGAAGDSMTQLVAGLDAYGIRQAEVDKARRDAAVKYANDAKGYAAASAAITEKEVKSRLSGYGDMAAAAKGFFSEGSRGYSTLSGIEKAYRAAELALALKSMTQKIFFKQTEVTANTALNAAKLTGEATASAASTGLAATEASAWGVTAVVKAIASLPFPLNLAAGAATMAAVIAVGAKMFGGVSGGGMSLSESRQKAQGTGTVLGSDAKSESISKSLDLIKDATFQGLNISTGMLHALRNIESNITNFAEFAVKTTMLGEPIATGSIGGAAEFGRSNWTQAAMGAAAAGPIGAVLAVALNKITGGWTGRITGSIMNKLFGGKETVEDTGFSVDKIDYASILAGGLNAMRYADIKKEGGLFRSDKYSTQTKSLGEEGNRQFELVLTSLYQSVFEAGKLLGLGADSFSAQLDSFVVDIGKISLDGLDDEAIQKELEAVFSKVGDQLAEFGVAGLQQFQRVGEGYLETLTRVATGYQAVSVVTESLGMVFGDVGTASIAARERLLDLAGGLSEFTSSAEQFMSDFYTDKERADALRARIQPTLDQFGIRTGADDTLQQFRDVVKSLKLETADGAQAFATLMQIAPAVKQIADIDAAKFEERLDLQNQLDELTMTSAQLLAKQRSALDESNRALFDQIEAVKAASEAQAAAAQAAKDRAANLLSGVDSAFSALQTVVGREKALIQETANAHRALSSALRGTLDSMSAAGQGIEDRQSARAQIQAALAIAKAGGVLPDADSLKGALSVLSKDASSMFATQQDYLRDFYSTQNDIAALAGLTDDALSVEEKSLKALDGILDSAQQQINALKGIDYSVLTLAQAISGFQGALGAAKADSVASAGGSIANLYRELLGRPADSAGLDYWQNAVAGGLSLDQVRKMIMDGAEFKGLKGIPGFANGGDHAGGLRWVGEFQPELEATGPSRIHTARSLMDALRSPADNSAAVVAELRAVRAELAAVKREIARGADSAGQLADQFDNATDGGNAMRADVFNVVRTKEVA